MTFFMNEFRHVKFMTFLKGIGKGNEILQPFFDSNRVGRVTKLEQLINESFEIRGNNQKTPNEILLNLKEGE